uniref:MATH domain-containing protein n=1 Tax=Strigamia maritima TaxID=126957 RepID=T1J4Q8_STRMM
MVHFWFHQPVWSETQISVPMNNLEFGFSDRDRCDSKNRLILKELPYGDICCQQCGQQIFKHEKACTESHSELCRYCNSPVDPDKIESHNDLCDMYPMNCDFCNAKFVRRTMNLHAQICAHSVRWCKFRPIGCKFQGTKSEIERHEGGNFHVELMTDLLLKLQTEQSRNTSMLAQSLNELMVLKDENVRRKSSVGIECQDVNLQQTEFCIEIKATQDNFEKSIKQQEIEINSCQQQIIDLESKQNIKLEEQLLEMQTLEKRLEIQTTMLTKQQAEQCDNVENNRKTLTTVIAANNLLTKVVAENKQMLTDKIANLEETIKWKEVEINSCQQQIFDLELKQNTKLDEQLMKMQKLEERLELQTDKMDKSCNELRTKLVDMEKDLRTKASSFSRIWKIEKFMQLQIDAKAVNMHVDSDPFYSSEFGYKMRLLLYPIGICDGVGTHLSIFLQVMSGENDAILKWPLEFTGKISILDQLNHKAHHSYKVTSDLIYAVRAYSAIRTALLSEQILRAVFAPDIGQSKLLVPLWA